MARTKITGAGFGKQAGKWFALAATATLLGGAGISARAVTLYTTSFEAPTYVAGTSVAGTDGWANGSGGGASQTVSGTRGNPGAQSLFFDNTGTNNSFYSVTHSLGAFAGTILTLSVNVYIPPTNGADRLAEVSFSTGTLGTTTLGFSIDGAGDLRAGTSWNALYSSTSTLATAAAGTYADRWLTVTLSLNSATGAGTVSASGFGGTTNSYSYNFTGSNTAPSTVNLGTDYIGTTARAGSVYYDGLSIANNAVPEPSTLAASALGAGLLGAWLRRRRTAV